MRNHKSLSQNLLAQHEFCDSRIAHKRGISVTKQGSEEFYRYRQVLLR